MDVKKSDFKEVTEATLKGKGLFDVLMVAQKAHLAEEYQQNRIKGSDYSKVYLGGLESVLTNTVQYLSATQLQEEQRQKLLADISLTKANEERLRLLLPLEQEQLKLANAKGQYELDNILPLQAEKLNLEKDRLQLDIDRFEYERTELWPIELERLKLEKDLIATQGILAKAEVELKNQQVINLREEAKLIPLQIAKMTAENKLIDKQILLIDAQIEKAVQEVLMMIQQVLKTEAEVELIKAKTDSEIANVIGNVEGLIGKQKDLLDAQIQGFKDDAVVKIDRVKSELFAVSRTTNPEGVGAIVPEFSFPTKEINDDDPAHMAGLPINNK